MMRPPMSTLIGMALEVEARTEKTMLELPESYRAIWTPSKIRETIFREIIAQLYDHIEHHIIYLQWGQCRQCWGRWSWDNLYHVGDTPGRPGEVQRTRRPTPGDEVYCEQCLPRLVEEPVESPPKEKRPYVTPTALPLSVPEELKSQVALEVGLYGPEGETSFGYPATGQEEIARRQAERAQAELDEAIEEREED